MPECSTLLLLLHPLCTWTCEQLMFVSSYTVDTGEPITVKGIKLSAENGKIGAGKSASLTVETTGTSPVYKWFKSGKPLTDGTVYNGATKATLQIEKATVNQSGKYWCEVSNDKSPKKISAQVNLDVSKSRNDFSAFYRSHTSGSLINTVKLSMIMYLPHPD